MLTERSEPMELNRFKEITSGYKKTIIAGLIGLSIGFTALVACADSNSQTAIQVNTTVPVTATVVTTTTIQTTLPPTTTTTLPDLSGVDWVAFARSVHGKCGEWHDLAIQVGWPEEEWPRLQQVIFRESRCQVDAWNGADAGLTQINQIHTKWLSDMGWSHPDDMFNAEYNLTFAFRLWETSGWRPWRFSGTTWGD
jgi:hypothetical protein